MGRILKYALFLILIGVILSGGAYFLAKKYEPEVKNAIVYELNQHLKAPVDVDDINFSLLQKFPYASLRFSQVVIPEVGQNKADTLLYIKDLYLQIGLLDFFSKEYRVSEAEVNEGFFQMKLFKEGTNNYKFWQSSADTTESSFSLKNIQFENFNYHLETNENLLIDVLVNQGEANGNFGTDKFELDADTDLLVKTIIYRGDTLYESKKIDGKVELNIDTESKRYSFHTEKISFAGETIKLDGIYDESGEGAFWDVDMASVNTDLSAATDLIPIPNQEIFKTYQPEGKANLTLNMNTTDGFSLILDFEHLKGEILQTQNMGKAEIYSGKGRYDITNGKSNLYLEGLQAGIGPGKFTIRGEIKDLTAPHIDLALQGRLELSELKEFLNMSFAELLEGRIDVKGKLEGDLKSNQLRADEILKGVDFLGEIALRDGAIKTQGLQERIQDIEGSFEIVDNSIKTTKLTAKTGDNEFEISGSIRNALPYLSGYGRTLEINADLKSEKIFLEQLISNENPSGSPIAFHLPEGIGFELDIDLKELDYKTFVARDLSGKAYYRNGLFTLNPFTMKVASGSVRGNFRMREVENGFELKNISRLSEIKVDELFANFDNFGQKVITQEQIEGGLSGQIELECFLDSTIAISKKSVAADVSLKIENGQLNEVQSLIDIADYIEGNALWNTFIKVDVLKKRLTNIEFETLENQLTIRNGLINIPEMSIATSVLNLDASGTHDFSNNIDYSINFRLNELLRTGKERKSEFGYVVDDGTGMRIFFKMEGTVDYPEFSSDKDSARETRKEKFETEKKTFRSILKEEFGLFKNDTTLVLPNTSKEEQSQLEFEVEFGDSLQTDTLTTKKKRKKKLSKKDEKLYEELEGDDDI